MTKRLQAGAVLLLTGAMLAASGAWAEVIDIDFDDVLNNAWYSGIWPTVKALGVMPEDFTLDPSECDINGGFDISVTPVILFPNDILDADEMAVISAILANPAFDQRAAGSLGRGTGGVLVS